MYIISYLQKCQTSAKEARGFNQLYSPIWMWHEPLGRIEMASSGIDGIPFTARRLPYSACQSVAIGKRDALFAYGKVYELRPFELMVCIKPVYYIVVLYSCSTIIIRMSGRAAASRSNQSLGAVVSFAVPERTLLQPSDPCIDGSWVAESDMRYMARRKQARVVDSKAFQARRQTKLRYSPSSLVLKSCAQRMRPVASGSGRASD